MSDERKVLRSAYDSHSFLNLDLVAPIPLKRCYTRKHEFSSVHALDLMHWIFAFHDFNIASFCNLRAILKLDLAASPCLENFLSLIRTRGIHFVPTTHIIY